MSMAACTWVEAEYRDMLSRRGNWCLYYAEEKIRVESGTELSARPKFR